MCRCTNNFPTSKLAYLEHMRILMSRPYIPEGKSIYDMKGEELELFKKKVEEWKKAKNS